MLTRARLRSLSFLPLVSRGRRVMAAILVPEQIGDSSSCEDVSDQMATIATVQRYGRGTAR